VRIKSVLSARDTGEKEKKFMKNKIKYTDENLGDGVNVIDDFLPTPTQLVLKKENNAMIEQPLNINLPE
jgi:hypothetical protein